MRFVTSLVLYLLLFNLIGIVLSKKDERSSCGKDCQDQDETKSGSCPMRTVLNFIGYGTAAYVFGTYGVPFLLGQMGFGTAGIIGKSVAAWWQASGYYPAVFSTIQSASVTGTAASIVTKTGVLAAGVKSYFTSCDSKESKKK